MRGKEALRLQAQQDVAAARAEVDSYKAALLEVKAVLKKERAERKAELASRDDTTGRASARVTKTQTTSSEKLVFWLGSAGKTTTSKAGSAAAPPIAKSSGTPKSTGSKTRALSEVTENSPSAVNTK